MAINVIQITALIVFTVIAIAYRMQHPQDSVGYHLSNGTPVNYQVDSGQSRQTTRANRYRTVGPTTRPRWTTKASRFTRTGSPGHQGRLGQRQELELAALGLAEGDPYPLLQKDASGKATLDKDGKPSPYRSRRATSPRTRSPASRRRQGSADLQLPYQRQLGARAAWIQLRLHPGLYRDSAAGRIRVRDLVGGRGARIPSGDIPHAVLLSLAIQGAFCYLFEYFAANLLPEQRLHDLKRGCLRARPSAT